MKKIVLILLLLGCGLLSACGAEKVSTPESTSYTLQSSPISATGAEDALVEISDNGSLVLYANLSSGTVAVEDKTQGVTWYSNPVERESDTVASGFNKNALMSAITVTYTTDTSVSMSVTSYYNCVADGGLSYCLEPDGSIVFIYYFVDENFYIPVRYSIEEDCFSATILSSYIVEGVDPNGADNTIQSIELLPFFGAASTEDDGYLLVPDGSGALIYYNNNRLTADTYSKELYGFDNGTSERISSGTASGSAFTVSENQYMPVFGSSCNETGFLAIITSGAARATIKANVAGKYTSYNTVWSLYSYRTVGTVNQTQKDGSELAVSINEKNLETWCDYSVSYYFLENGENTYADMAALYREYLTQNEGLEARVSDSEQIPLYLDLYGYIEKTKSFLGIPRDTKISMTTVEDVGDILDTLLEADISNVVVNYNYWADDSFFRKIPTTAKVDSKVGTASEMLQLQERLEDAGGALYLSADLLNVYKTGNGVSQYSDVLQSAANTALRQYEFALDTAQVDSRYDAWYLLRPASLSEFFGKFSGNMASAGYTNLSLENVGTMLYSELSSNGVGRNQALEIMRSTVSETADSASGLLLEGANEYVATLATHILETSASSSGYDIEDVSVPFYQMVFHGYVSYSLSASNLASNPADQTLNCIEYGAYPLFSLVAENVDELIGSRLDDLYSADIENWMEFIQAQYEQINSALSGVQTSTIVGHTILSDDVRQVTYSNGTTIYVNYGDSDVSVDGVTVLAKGFAVADGSGTVICSQAAVGD